VVVADTQALAEDALEAIAVDIAPLPAVPDRQAAAGDKSLLFETSGSNRAVRYSVSTGDADAAFVRAEYTRRESFRCHRLTAVPLETRGLIAEWDAAKQRLVIFGATKVLFFNRRVLAPMLGLSEQAIDMIELDVGGGFGVRGEFYPEDFLIPSAARHVGRPVKWIEDRREHLMSTNHSREVDCDLEIACTRDGTILGLRGHIYGDMGAYIRTNGGVVPAKAGQFLPGPYRIRDVAITVEALMTSKTPVGTVRAPGRFEANFFRERLLDIVAGDLGLDPMDFRRRNLIGEAELPFATGKLVPYEGETDFDTGDYHATFERVLSEIGWAENEVAARPSDRWTLSWPRRRALRGEQRLGQGERPRQGRGGWRRHRLCRVVGAGTGARDDPGAGRRRYAQIAVRARAHSARLDHLCARGFRHIRVPLHGGRRIGGDEWLRQSPRRHPRGGHRTLRPAQ